MIALMDGVAAAVERSYGAYLLQVVGAFAQVMEEPAPTAPGTRSRLGLATSHAQIQLLTDLATKLDAGLGQIVDGAIADSKSTLSEPQRENIDQLVREARNALMGEFALAAAKDSGVVAKTLREFALNVDMLMSAQGSSYGGAVVSARMDLDTDFRFTQLDRAGRRWTSPNYARTSARGLLVNTYVDTNLYALTTRGVDIAKLSYAEAEHRFKDVVFSITGDTKGLPALGDIRAEVFHPNTRAMIVNV